MNKLIASIIFAGFITLAVNAAAHPVVYVQKGITVIVLDPVVVIAPRPCSAPRALVQGSGTVRTCEAGAL